MKIKEYVIEEKTVYCFFSQDRKILYVAGRIGDKNFGVWSDTKEINDSWKRICENMIQSLKNSFGYLEEFGITPDNDMENLPKRAPKNTDYPVVEKIISDNGKLMEMIQK